MLYKYPIKLDLSRTFKQTQHHSFTKSRIIQKLSWNMRYSNMLKVININKGRRQFWILLCPRVLLYLFLHHQYSITFSNWDKSCILLSVLYPINVFDQMMTGGCSFWDQKVSYFLQIFFFWAFFLICRLEVWKFKI